MASTSRQPVARPRCESVKQHPLSLPERLDLEDMHISVHPHWLGNQVWTRSPAPTPLEVEHRRMDLEKLRKRLQELPGFAKEHDIADLGTRYKEEKTYEPCEWHRKWPPSKYRPDLRAFGLQCKYQEGSFHGGLRKCCEWRMQRTSLLTELLNEKEMLREKRGVIETEEDYEDYQKGDVEGDADNDHEKEVLKSATHLPMKIEEERHNREDSHDEKALVKEKGDGYEKNGDIGCGTEMGSEKDAMKEAAHPSINSEKKRHPEDNHDEKASLNEKSSLEIPSVDYAYATYFTFIADVYFAEASWPEIVDAAKRRRKRPFGWKGPVQILRFVRDKLERRYTKEEIDSGEIESEEGSWWVRRESRRKALEENEPSANGRVQATRLGVVLR